MTLIEQIRQDMKEAMIAKDSNKVTTLRGVISACTNELVALGRKPQDAISDEETIAVIRRAVKQRKDAIDQFIKGGRQDLADNEEAEMKILNVYLPELMGYDKVLEAVKAKQTELGINDKTGMGKLMGAVMKDLKGLADGEDVKKAVEEALN